MKIGSVTGWAGLFMTVLFIACQDNDNSQPTGFDVAASTGAEDAGTQSATLKLNKAATSDVTVTFALKGTAALNGDYTLLTPSPITVKAGSSVAQIDFKIIDDSVIEATDKKITFEITGVTDQTLDTNSDRLAYTYTITDNDKIPTDGMQVDLTWDLGEGVDIDSVNLDMYLVYNVVVENNQVTSLDINQDVYSEKTSGFESFVIGSAVKDTEYYVAAVYKKGSVAVPFTFGFSTTANGSSESTGSFTSTDAGSALFYGPIQKSGNTFSRSEGPRLVKYKINAKVLSGL
jgi:hypothetical protein